MNTLLIILVVLIILVLPIPIKFTLIYYKNSLHIYLYRKEITFKKRVPKKVSHNIKSRDYIGRIQYYFHTAKNLSLRLKLNKFRPQITFLLNISTGFEDAAETAVCCGALYSFSPVIYIILRNYFNVKKYSFTVNPDYDSPKFEARLNSIIWISIVNTIYISILVIYTIKKGNRIKTVENSRKSSFENTY